MTSAAVLQANQLCCVRELILDDSQALEVLRCGNREGICGFTLYSKAVFLGIELGENVCGCHLRVCADLNWVSR